ncbi:MAG: lytic transglycosylase domain-containing protein [Acetobacteraceae bacterium]|nr:lytic transglycosylase domain-containing protein [Acetobacteraceae bacterium]
MRPPRSAIALVLLSLCAGCSGSRYATSWDGRRGYDGNGDYGYDLAASRSEARTYRARAASSYPAPGMPDDPWGPYIQEAAARYRVPERWIRAVMRQESGGRQFNGDGMLVTSSAGAMGLMQVMPRTYETLQRRYGLGSDPYDPHNNILAGTAYIREMYDRYGSPAFLAAYNAGPDNLDAYLSGGSPLPDETVNYLASVAPQLGTEVAMTGPLAVYGGGGGFRQVATSEADRAYAGGGMTGAQYQAAQYQATGQAPSGPSAGYGDGGFRQVAASDADGAYAGGGMTGAQYQAATETGGDPSDRAFDGGGLVTPSAPTGVLTAQAAAVVAPVVATSLPVPANGPAYRTPAMVSPVTTRTMGGGDWGIQVGAYPNPETSRSVIAAARMRAGSLLAAAQPAITPVQRGGVLFRARLVGLSPETASAACSALSSQGIDCFTVPPGS